MKKHTSNAKIFPAYGNNTWKIKMFEKKTGQSLRSKCFYQQFFLEVWLPVLQDFGLLWLDILLVESSLSLPWSPYQSGNHSMARATFSGGDNWGVQCCKDEQALEIIINHQCFQFSGSMMSITLYLLTYNCQQSNISFQHISTHLIFIKSFGGSVKTKGCTSFWKKHGIPSFRTLYIYSQSVAVWRFDTA